MVLNFLTPQRIIVNSFSGGRTSAFMTKLMQDRYSGEFTIINLFANTGQEDEKTLRFIRDCDINFGFKTVWLESVFHKGRKGTTHRVVTFETATRDHSLFESMIQKYGIPNKGYPHCTRELKLQPITSFLRSLKIKKQQRLMAIGLRMDEDRRINLNIVKKENIIYPLRDLIPSYKQDVLDYWDEQKFDLDLPEHLGNCTWCWKKSLNKHMHVINDRPRAFDVPVYLGDKYPFAGNGSDKERPRKFFRGDRTAHEILADYKSLNGNLPRIVNDNGACSSSCEMFQMDLIERK